MTDPTMIPERVGMAAVRDQLKSGIAALEKLPNMGSVLFCSETALAIGFAEDDPTRPSISGLQHARIFSESERGLGQGQAVEHLRHTYRDGANRLFMLTDLHVAKQHTIAKMASAVSTIESQLAALSSGD